MQKDMRVPTCWRCTSPVVPGGGFCAACGAGLAPTADPRQSTGRTTMVLTLAVLALAVFVLIGAAAFVATRETDPRAAPAASATASAPEVERPAPREPAAAPPAEPPEPREAGDASSVEQPENEATAVHRASGFTVRAPASWTLTVDDEQETTYRRTKWVAPDGRSFVAIDHTEDVSLPAESSARHVESLLREVSSYRRLTFAPTTLGDGRSAFEWTFDSAVDGRTERRIDLFVNVGGDGFAVLGGGTASLDVVRDVARTMADSIEVR